MQPAAAHKITDKLGNLMGHAHALDQTRLTAACHPEFKHTYRRRHRRLGSYVRALHYSLQGHEPDQQRRETMSRSLFVWNSRYDAERQRMRLPPSTRFAQASSPTHRRIKRNEFEN